MLNKTETECLNCNTNYAVVTPVEDDVQYCPFCGTMISDEDMDLDSDDE